MVKKIAAPRKAGPKAPARKTAKAKSVTAPKTHAPKGSPKERLAYLNKGEMKALVQRKGSPARKGPKGIPSFADDSASSKGVSRGDSYGTKGSGSTKTSTGSVSKSSSSSSSGSSGYKGGQGGQGGYNSGTSGSRFGGASTQAPGMGRNSGRVGPVSPMSGQGASFATPKAARDDVLRKAYGIEDERGLQNMPQRPYIDRYGPVNPNLPQRDAFDLKRGRDINAARDAEARRMGDFDLDDYRNPQEIRANAQKWRDILDKSDAILSAKNRGLERSSELSQGRFKTNVARGAAASRIPDIRLGVGRRSGFDAGYSGGGGGGTFRGDGWGDESYYNGKGGSGWKAGGLVKNNKKTFKDK